MSEHTHNDTNINKFDSVIAQMDEVSDVVGWTFVSILWSFANKFCGLKARLNEFTPRPGHGEEDLVTIKRWEQRLDDYSNILSICGERANKDLMVDADYLVKTFIKPSDFVSTMPEAVAEAFQEHADLDDEEMAVFEASMEQSAKDQAAARRESLVRQQADVTKALQFALEADVGAFELTDVDLVALLNIVADRCDRYRFSKLKMAARQRRMEQQFALIADAKLLKGLKPSVDEAAHVAEQQLQGAGNPTVGGRDQEGREQTELH